MLHFILNCKTRQHLKHYTLHLILLLSAVSYGQPSSYTAANAHSHNDYEQPVPFYAAWHEGFGSIEADIFLYNNELLVAHDARQLSAHHTLEDLYLKPLQACIEKNSEHRLQLMIDIKTDGVTTLQQLVLLLQKYPLLTSASSLKIVISGNRPAPD